MKVDLADYLPYSPSAMNLMHILHINSTTKGLVSDPREINSTFHAFFQKWYDSTFELDTSQYNTFIENINLPKLNEKDSQSLDEPISPHEFESVLNCIIKRKTLGPDGIPPEFLLNLWDILGQPLLNSINSAIKKVFSSTDNDSALISLIPKKGKDLSECGNFHPISLIDYDIKLYSKVGAPRVPRYIYG